MHPRNALEGADGEQALPGDLMGGDDTGHRGSGAGHLYLWKLVAQKRLIAVITILIVGAATAHTFVVTPMYRSTATVLVKPVGVNLAVLGPKDPNKLVNLDTETQLVLSSDVAAAAAAKVGGGATASALVRHMKVTPVKNAPAMEISYEGPSPTEARDAAMAFASAYLANRGAEAAALVGSQLESLRADIAQTVTEIRRLGGVIAARRGSAESADARASLRGQEQRLVALQTQADAVQFDNVEPGAIIHAAQVPAKPYSPNGPYDIGLAALLGLAVAIGVALVRDRIDPRVRERSVLEAALGAPLLTVVPPAPQDDGRSGGVLALSDPDAPGTEAFRALRASVLAALPDGGTILVASSLPNEGKTTVASNLSVVLAQADKGVVLISADVRKPQLHLLFGVSNSQGLSTILGGARTHLECLADTESPNLLVCPAGPLPPNPAEMLQSEGMRELVATLRQTADFVVLDCPPVLAVSDALGLVPIADAVIFVVDAETTKRMAVREASYRLRQVGARIVGGVLNKMPLSAGAYGYTFGYGYGPAPHEGSATRRS